MNFIWDIVLQGERDKLPMDNIFFRPSAAPSPCYEQSFDCLNETQVKNPVVEINPLYRFTEIFQYLLHPDVFGYLEKESQQFILYAFDTIVHILAEVDLCHGLTRREFYVRQVRRDIQAGVHGTEIADAYNTMDKESQLAIADEFFNVIKTGSCLGSFCRITKQMFPGCLIYQVRLHPQIIYVYLDRARTINREIKWQLLLEIFLPFDMECTVFWDKHFGIMGIDVTMQPDRIAIF